MKNFFKSSKNTTIKHYSVLKKSEDIADQVLRLVHTIKSKNEAVNFLAKTNELKAFLKNGKSLDEIMIEAYANAYLAIEKVYGISLFKVQIMGAYALNQGDVAEMKTGEGKTLTAILPAYLNSLEGKGVFVITVNEYLANRDAYNCGRVYSELGLTTGCVLREKNPFEKKQEYAKDITYTTNSELGFDYLRDNMTRDVKQKSQRGFNFAIIDEVDSILIDEARTPLIISGGSVAATSQYREADDLVRSLNKEDYTVDKESQSVFLTQSGVKKAEMFFDVHNLFSFQNSLIVHRIQNSLHAHYLLTFDVEYTVKDGEIVLIDIFTGRLLPGRTFSEGLNQALEAKEQIQIKPETSVVATVTYQNLFRMFKKISGMTGTAITEEEEFINVYNMRVIPIPTNRGINRIDHTDLIFSTTAAKFKYIIKKIKELHVLGQPILVGTRSVVDSEYISNQLHEIGLKHEVLNAKNNATEADIISKAGQKGAITISTNMAGRGTDIKLGDGVIELGGLFVLGTERHESRRIDNQLRGRAGRQGDIGHAQFILSLEDEVLVRSGLKKIKKFAKSLDETPLESKTLTRLITSAQKKIEGLNYDSRKSVIEYDDVGNRQRIITYKQRDIILNSNNLLQIFGKLLNIYCEHLLNAEGAYINSTFSSESYVNLINEKFELEAEDKIEVLKDAHALTVLDHVTKKLQSQFLNKIKKQDKDQVNDFLKKNMIMSIDYNWQLQLEKLSKLRSAIHFRQYAQKNPVQAYLAEADKLYEIYKNEIAEQTVMLMFRTNVVAKRPVMLEDPTIKLGTDNNREIKELTL